MCIGNSCCLLHNAQTEIILNSSSMDDISSLIDRHILEQKIDTTVVLGDESARPSYPSIEDWCEGDLKELALVIDTATLKLIFAVPDEYVVDPFGNKVGLFLSLFSLLCLPLTVCLSQLTRSVHPSSSSSSSQSRNRKYDDFPAKHRGLRIKFLRLAICCRVCICCRVTPAQKGEVVNLVKLNLPAKVILPPFISLSPSLSLSVCPSLSYLAVLTPPPLKARVPGNR